MTDSAARKMTFHVRGAADRLREAPGVLGKDLSASLTLRVRFCRRICHAHTAEGRG